MHCPSSLPPPRRSPSPFLLSLSVPPLPSSSSFPPTLAFLLSSSLRFSAGIFLFPPPRLFANSVHPFLLPSSFLYRLLLFLHSPPFTSSSFSLLPFPLSSLPCLGSPSSLFLFTPLTSFLSPSPYQSLLFPIPPTPPFTRLPLPRHLSTIR